MNKKIISTVLVLVLSMSIFVGCGSKTDDLSDNAEITTEAPTTIPEATATPEPTEEPHEHAYVETITTEVSCETNGEATYTCECGDTYTETIKALGHIYEIYTFNNDATYLADGTETAKCNGCDLTDTRTAEGSMLTYTYTDMDTTMYAQKTVNVRSMPSTDGEKLGSLSTNDEVKVTGQCAETNWYRIEFDGNVAYVGNSYLGNDRVVVQTETPAQNSSSGVYNIVLKSGYSYIDTPISTYEEASAVASALGYDLYQMHDDSNGGIWCYVLYGELSDGRTEDVFDQLLAHSGHYEPTNQIGTKDGRIYLTGSDGYVIGWIQAVHS